MGRPIGNRAAKHGRQSSVRRFTDKDIAARSQIRGEQLTEDEQHLLHQVALRCLGFDDDNKQTDFSGLFKVARLVAPHVATGKCSHMTIYNALRGAPLSVHYLEAIRKMLPVLVQRYYPEALEDHPEMKPFEEVGIEEQLRRQGLSEASIDAVMRTIDVLKPADQDA